jgi:L-threonylcarbamoyladenylate synthase
MILDGGPCPGGIESTVVDVTGRVVRLLRPGLVTVPMLEEVVGKVETASRDSASQDSASPGLASRERERPEQPARSPGQMEKHYSPRTPLVLAEDADEADGLHRKFLDAGLRVKSVGFDLIFDYYPMPGDAERYAAELYSVLHELDDGRYDRIVIEMPPDTPEWAAVRDRLTRAASM